MKPVFETRSQRLKRLFDEMLTRIICQRWITAYTWEHDHHLMLTLGYGSKR